MKALNVRVQIIRVTYACDKNSRDVCQRRSSGAVTSSGVLADMHTRLQMHRLA